MKKYERTLILSFNFLRDELCGKKNEHEEIRLFRFICVPFVQNCNEITREKYFFPPLTAITATQKKIQIFDNQI